MVKNFKFVHFLIIGISFILISPPVKANIIQALLLIANFILTNQTGFSANIRQSSAGAQSQANAIGMSTEVIGGTIAEQTKTLGKLKYEMEFGSLGSVGGIKIDSTAPGGCFAKSRETGFKKYALLSDETNESVFPEVNGYAAPVLNYDRDEDMAERMNILQRMDDSDFPVQGLFINDNITIEQRALWADFVRHVTVPSPIVISQMGVAGAADDQYIAAYRYKMLVGQLQNTLLRQGDSYAALEGDSSRADMLKKYQAYAASFKRTKATNLKTKTGVQRELAEAQAMLLDVESEIMEVNKSLTGLVSIMAVKATDEMADEF